MPIYEFECEQCHAQFERLTRSAQQSEIACPKCGSPRTQKKISVFASSSGSSSGDTPSCSGTPRSCGRCGTGTPHSHG